MKIAALVQFYLPYVLPRQVDWQGKGFTFQTSTHTVSVRPRNFDEDLFPNEIDKALSTMEVHLFRLSLPISATLLTVKDVCHDRVETIVRGEVSNQEHINGQEIHEEYKQLATRSCNLVLNHCRVVSRSHFIVGVEQHYRLEDSRYYTITPHTMSWFNGESGEPIPAYNHQVNAAASSGAILSPERGDVSLIAINDSISRGEQPKLTTSLLVDTRERVVTLRLREAIISIATACEVAADEYLRRLGKDNDNEVKKILNKKASFAEKRLHLITDLISGRSMKREDLLTFEKIERAYRARNNIAHQGRAFYKEGSLEITVDAIIATNFLNAAEKAVEWLEAI